MTVDDELREITASDRYPDDDLARAYRHGDGQMVDYDAAKNAWTWVSDRPEEIRAARNVTRWLVVAATVVFAAIAWWLP